MTRQRGFTLIEVIIFIVVVGAGLAGILSVFNTTVKSSADPMVRKQTVAIAESLLEEILQKEFAKPVGSTSVACCAAGWRALADAVTDYNGYSTTTGVTDLSGTATPGLASYNIAPAVLVSNATATDNANLVTAAALKVTVSVTGPQGVITLVGYRASP